ncbi:hypothetical protein ES319_A11G227600v1 [Gossypium barbadense]|uniref:Uncharacterized protein n=1 Tax=Gossypium barbadense TaxID=3634 RepID=A0A5J5TRJ2_GOSBA|nr:hypothetical protein ES319_A11G227600v1 [Gossypium barbadense]
MGTFKIFNKIKNEAKIPQPLQDPTASPPQFSCPSDPLPPSFSFPITFELPPPFFLPRSPDAFYLPLYILDDNTTPASEIGVVQKLWGVCVCVHLRLSKKQRTLPMVKAVLIMK